MKCVEEYAQRKVDEKVDEVILNFYGNGVKKEVIANSCGVSLDYVENVLSSV